MSVAGRLIPGLALALLLLALGDSGSFGGPARKVFANTWQCVEYDTDYSLQCRSESTRCGSFCFYAVCVRCTDDYHEHCRTDCDAENNCSTVCWDERHGISPCLSWLWYLHDPGLGRSVRSDDYQTPDFSLFMELGVVDSDYTIEPPPCVTELGANEIIPAASFTGVPLPEPTIVSDSNDGHITSRVVGNSEEIVIGDLSHLPETPREDGGPSIGEDVIKVDDSSVELDVSDWGSGTREYRYWSYNGLRKMVDGVPGPEEASPSRFRVPFRELTGNVVRVESGLKGIFSFQVRSVDSDGIASGNSNIVHQMIGMGGFHIPGPRRGSLIHDIRPPLPTVYGEPLPPLDGVSRPEQPQIRSAVRVVGVPGTVDVELAGSYSDRVQYRWWPHSSLGPTGRFTEWYDAPVSSGTFPVSGVRPVGSVFGNLPSVALFDFEVRLVNDDDIPGDSSRVVVTLVVLTPDMPQPAPAVYDSPLLPLDGVSRPVQPGINGVTQVLGAWGAVDIELAGSYSGQVQYRWWPHSGFGPTAGRRTGTESYRDWIPAPTTSGTFRVSGVEPKTTLGEPGISVVPVIGGLPSPFLFDFQVRLVNEGGIPGDASGAVSVLVWGGGQGAPVLRGRPP